MERIHSTHYGDQRRALLNAEMKHRIPNETENFLITIQTLSSSRSVSAIQCHSDDPIKKNVMGRACGMYGGQERCIQEFGTET